MVCGDESCWHTGKKRARKCWGVIHEEMLWSDSRDFFMIKLEYCIFFCAILFLCDRSVKFLASITSLPYWRCTIFGMKLFVYLFLFFRLSYLYAAGWSVREGEAYFLWILANRKGSPTLCCKLNLQYLDENLFRRDRNMLEEKRKPKKSR